MVIDLSLIRDTRVDPEKGTVRVGGGSTLGDVDQATSAFGLAVPTGTVSMTGIGGLTLGGGIGHLTRKYGLTIDNLLAVDMVLADGRIVTASEQTNPELFWAVRGGGGNFGIVTSFLYKASPVGIVTAGPILYELDQTAAVLKWYREYITRAPDDLSGFFAFLNVPPASFPPNYHNRSMCGIIWCYCGPPDKAEKVLRPVREFLHPAIDLVGPMSYLTVQSMFDALLPPGLNWYWRGDFFNEIGDEAIEIHRKYGSSLPTPLSTMHLYPVNGAAARVGNNDTAWSYRDATWAAVYCGIDPDPANNERITPWSKDYHEALHPYSAGGAYINFMLEEKEDRIRNTYRDNFDRLVKVKSLYDPNNFFRVNQNIAPSRQSTPAVGG